MVPRTIRSLLGIIDFKNDYKELAKKLKPFHQGKPGQGIVIALFKKLWPEKAACSRTSKTGRPKVLVNRPKASRLYTFNSIKSNAWNWANKP